ncbi:hypothetical protein [Bernardetia sp.]|uniref:hypothetical protein n=1 Tax=Bernardetia sp. TaxID=1937974 RepID=UPI0025C703E4|nr:hypothetical protein [Bernardetia sp.]
MGQKPVKSLQMMTKFDKKTHAKRITNAREKVKTHLELMQSCKQTHQKMPVFDVKKTDFEVILESMDIALDALHGTPINMFPEEQPKVNKNA